MAAAVRVVCSGGWRRVAGGGRCQAASSSPRLHRVTKGFNSFFPLTIVIELIELGASLHAAPVLHAGYMQAPPCSHCTLPHHGCPRPGD